jgi:hypothetical protein
MDKTFAGEEVVGRRERAGLEPAKRARRYWIKRCDIVASEAATGPSNQKIRPDACVSENNLPDYHILGSRKGLHVNSFAYAGIA